MAKSYYEDVINKAGLESVKAEDLQAKFDAATKAEYDKQRTNLQTTENKFYNQLYDTQKTTMDTIRQNNAASVATGASRGIQAANELSALLGLQQESVEGATDIANKATTIAQDEAQAMLENVLTAEQQAREANQKIAEYLVQAGSVDVENKNATTAAEQVKQQWQQLIEQIRLTNATKAEELQAQYDAYYKEESKETPDTPSADTSNSDTSTSTSTSTNTSTSGSTSKGTLIDLNMQSNSTHSVMRHQIVKEALQKAGYSGNVYGTDIPEGYTLSIKTLPGVGDNLTLKYTKGKWYVIK